MNKKHNAQTQTHAHTRPNDEWHRWFRRRHKSSLVLTTIALNTHTHAHMYESGSM